MAEAAAQVHWVARAAATANYNLSRYYHSENPGVRCTFLVLRVFDIRGDSHEPQTVACISKASLH
jgi:hypothetical protein